MKAKMRWDVRSLVKLHLFSVRCWSNSSFISEQLSLILQCHSARVYKRSIRLRERCTSMLCCWRCCTIYTRPFFDRSSQWKIRSCLVRCIMFAAWHLDESFAYLHGALRTDMLLIERKGNASFIILICFDRSRKITSDSLRFSFHQMNMCRTKRIT